LQRSEQNLGAVLGGSCCFLAEGVLRFDEIMRPQA